MTNKMKRAAVCGIMTVALLGTAGGRYQALATTYQAETPLAGSSVIFDQYFALPAAQVASTDVPAVQTEASAPDEEDSIFDTIAVSRVADYVNVRSAPSTDSEILGKIYDGCAATIVGIEGEWYRIDSGSIKGGYIKAEYFVTGDEARALAADLAVMFAVVNTTTLKVRSEPSTDSACLTLVPLGEEFVVMEEQGNWAKIEVDASTSGWVCMDYLDCRVVFDTAVSLEEEEAARQEKAAAEQRAEEARRALEEQRAVEERAVWEAAQRAIEQAQVQSEDGSAAGVEEAAPADTPVQAALESPVSEAAPTDTLREAIVSYALQFVGNPYVYGGNSLTKGTDCSGFVKLIYAEFGYSLQRRASLQYAHNGTKISLNEVRPGDLMFYGNGGVNHVAMYIGNGQVVHASTEKTGIRISNMNYRTVYGVVRILD
jgi:cell wall-associated NlpC family hydrolase